MKHLLERRSAGVLLHPSSLPGPGYCGDFGADARRFVDLVAAAGLQIWQVLPLGPTHEDGCPYQSFSVHAGNPDLIDLQWLARQGWLTPQQAERGQADRRAKREALRMASRAFSRELEAGTNSPTVSAYHRFLEREIFWLEDDVRFQAFRDAEQRRPWTTWPRGLREYDRTACDARALELIEKISALRFRQFVFDCQWHELRNYANDRGVQLFGHGDG